MSNCFEQEWKPENILSGDLSLKENYCVVVLNREIFLNAQLFFKLWNNAIIRCTVDGGADKFLDFLQKHDKLNEVKCPDIVSGDFDSITPKSLNYYKKMRNVEVIETPCQDETDFTKALKLIHSRGINHDIKTVIAVFQTSGRMDHIMDNINTLYKSINIIPNVIVYLMASNSLTWLLRPGKHRIEIPQFIFVAERWCSLTPIGNPTVVTTTGLKWNLSGKRLEFGGVVSTSNTYSENVVTIETEKHILWSMGT